MLKSYGWGGVVVHVILVSAKGPNPSFFFFGGLLFDLGACWDKGLDSDMDQGLTIIFPSLTYFLFLAPRVMLKNISPRDEEELHGSK